jgi:DNA polymerase elongation subunit (family B)
MSDFSTLTQAVSPSPSSSPVIRQQTVMKSQAFIRSNIRKYGGCLAVQDPLPCPLAFQIMDMKVLDPNELISTSVEYNSYMTRDIFYQNSMATDGNLNDLSQVVIFGRTEFGNSICVRVPFQPFLFLYAPNIEWTQSEQKALHSFLQRVLGLEPSDIKIQHSLTKRLDGWVPDPTCSTKTEEIPVLRISLPNKKIFERMVEIVDPTKNFERILQNTLKKLKEELEGMQTYKYCNKRKMEKMMKTLNGIDGRLKHMKRNIEKAKRDPDDISDNGRESSLPQHFTSPAVTEMKFQCKDFSSVWETWKERHRLVFQYIEWWKQTGFKIKNIRNLVKPVLWETRVDYVHKFCDQTHIIPSGWMELLQYERPDGYISHAQIECLSYIQNVRPLEKTVIAPLLIASVDGEMYTSNPRTFPNPLKADNCVITIGVVLCRTNSTDMERFVFCLKDTDASQVTDATVFQFNDEQEMLRKWRDFMTVEADPDFVTGYNILGFDWRYFAHRAAQTFANKDIIEKLKEEESDGEDSGDDEEKRPARKNPRAAAAADDDDGGEGGGGGGGGHSGIDLLEGSSRSNIIGPGEPGSGDMNQTVSRFFRLSRIWAELTPCRPQVFKSSAYGERWSYHFDMTGRAVQDLMIYIRREHKLESYKLDAVSEHFLKDNKIDLEPKLLFKYFESGPKERGLIAEYCVKDCILPIKLCKHSKLMVVQNLIEMSRVTYTPLPQIINRGQQIKVFNQLVIYAHMGGFVMNDQPHRDVDGYEGATVLDPKPGWYDCPVVVLDFASLYPSITINKNLCYSTIVRDPKYMNLPGVDYHVIKVGERTHVFVKNTILKGVLPMLEEHLLSARRNVKKQMKTEKNNDVYAMLDAKQLAIKISCNSVYGFTGASNGMYAEPAIAESITATGRTFIDTTREGVLNQYKNSEVLYGDSVTGETALLLRRNGQVTIVSIENLWTQQEQTMFNGSSKEYLDLTGWETWTEQGWSRIERIMRHKISKPIVRVLTHNGVVDVTEDHSLLRVNGTEVSPKDVKLGDELLHSFPNEWTETLSTITPREAKIMGFFMGDGSSGTYDTQWGVKYAWALNNANLEMLQRYLDDCRAVYSDLEFAIDDTIASSGVYKLTARGSPKTISVFYSQILYDETRNKRVPDCILSAPMDVRSAFWQGYYDADGDKDLNGYVRFDAKHQVSALSLYTLARSLGYNCSINTRADKPDIYRITCTKKSQRRNSLAIKKIVNLKTEGDTYVYDLTTSNHHFHAGVGSLIVHNTDSVFIKFDVTPDMEGLKKALDIGTEAADKISKIFGEAVKLEREKAYFPFLLYGKKRYIGRKWEEADKDKGLDTKGIEIARRDWSALIRTIYKKCINKVFFERDVMGAKRAVQEYCQDMIDGKLDPNWFVMSKELKSGYANPDSQVHVNVVKNIARRTPGSEPQVGDRVPYVIIRKKTKKACEKSEDPEYARRNKIPLDYEYYMEKQLERPLTDFFGMFNQAGDLFTEIRRQLHNEYAGVGRNGLMAYFKPQDSETKIDTHPTDFFMETPSTSPSTLPLLSSTLQQSTLSTPQPPKTQPSKRKPSPVKPKPSAKKSKGKTQQSTSKPQQTLFDFM